MSQIPDVEIKSARRSLWDRVSVVWLVPLAALAIALGVAWQTFNERGPLILIRFDDAAGIAKNETELRYRDVAVGIVETVKFTERLEQVEIGVRVDKDVAEFIDSEAQFWVVRPEVTTQGVSGLDTVLSGVYIEGNWDERPGEPESSFEGLIHAPLLPGGQQGLRVLLRSTDGSLSGNTPMLYKGVEVGRVGDAQVSADGFAVEAEAVIFAPYDNLVTTQTRFWDTSGFSLSIGTSGAAVDFDSLASLIAGGVTFDTFVSGATLAQDGAEFTVFGDGGAARASIFERTDGVTLDLVAVFDGNVAGLTTGAPVELNGLRIGQVSGLNGIVDESPTGESRVRLQTILSIEPSRLGLDGSGSAEEALDFLADQVDQGLRARLATGSILTGGLKVQLISTGFVGTDTLDRDGSPFPTIPVTDNDLVDVQATAQGALDRLNNLPIEELLNGATSFLNNASILIGSPETQQVPADVSAMLAEIRNVVGSEAVQGLPEQLAGVMAEIETSVSEVRKILEAVEGEQIVARVGSAVDAATVLTTDLEATVEGLPSLLAEIEALAAKANGLALDDLVAEVTALSASANGLIGAEATQALPDRIASVAGELDAALAEVQLLVAGLNDNAASARILEAVDAATETAQSLDASFAGVPDLIAQISVVAEEAQGMDLATLTASINDLVVRADALVASEATQALPAELTAALAEVRALLTSVNGNDTVVRLLAAVDAAAAAAEGLDRSVEGVPALVDSLNVIAADARGLELDALIAQVNSLIGSADALLAAPGTQALPEELTLSLAELRRLMAELNDGGAIENTNAALLSARNAADEIAAAAESLPVLLNRANALLAQADTTLSGFEDTSPAIRDARAALQEVARAAEAVASLARAIERRPNSLLVGR